MWCSLFGNFREGEVEPVVAYLNEDWGTKVLSICFNSCIPRPQGSGNSIQTLGSDLYNWGFIGHKYNSDIRYSYIFMWLLCSLLLCPIYGLHWCFYMVALFMDLKQCLTIWSHALKIIRSYGNCKLCYTLPNFSISCHQTLVTCSTVCGYYELYCKMFWTINYCISKLMKYWVLKFN